MMFKNKEVIAVKTGIADFKVVITGLRTAERLTKDETYKNFIARALKENQGKIQSSLISYVKTFDASLHTINIPSIRVSLDKGMNYSINYTYTYPDFEEEYKEVKKTYEELVKEKDALKSKVDSLSKQLASEYKRASKNMSRISKLRSSLTEVSKKMGSTDTDVLNAAKKMKTMEAQAKSDLDKATYWNKTTIVSLQEGINIVAEKLIRNEPVPIVASNGEDIVLSRLSMKSVMESDTIPPFVKSQYLMLRAAEKISREEYSKIIDDAIQSMIGKK